MPLRRGPLVWASFLLIPLGVASPDPGSEQRPELQDLPDDVAYDPLYTGPKNLAYIDILGGWFDHDDVTDRITLHWKVRNTDGVESASVSHSIHCLAVGELSGGGGPSGNLTFSAYRGRGTPEFRGSIRYERTDPTSAPVGGYSAAIESQFRFRPGAPGYFEWTANRTPLLLRGDEVSFLRGGCYDVGWVATDCCGYPVYQNEDRAESDSVYSFKELRRVAGPDGVKDPLEAYTPPPESTSPSATEAASGALGLVATIGILFAASRLRRGAPR